jgi:ribonuclease VapC
MTAFAVDASAIVAVLKAEPEFVSFQNVLAQGDWVIGCPTLLELKIWKLRNPGFDQLGLIDLILNDETINFASFDRALETLAADAYANFGKGRHPAKLNYGDCMSYAVAKHLDLPLLFKGADFGQTDVRIHPDSVMTSG